MNYKQALVEANAALSQDAKRRFVGYNLRYGFANGTLEKIDHSQIVDTPIAENLLMGLSIGLSLKGYKPVAFIERFDFILNALDAIVNHLDKMHALSHGEFSPAVIIRTMVGNRDKPLFTGPPHTQDFTLALRKMVSFPVISLRFGAEIKPAYEQAARDQEKGVSTLLVEHKDFM